MDKAKEEAWKKYFATRGFQTDSIAQFERLSFDGGYDSGYTDGYAAALSASSEQPLSKAVETLQAALRSDPDLYFAWQSNIAMAFVDSFESPQTNGFDLYATANDAAKRFLDSLIRPFTVEENKV